MMESATAPRRRYPALRIPAHFISVIFHPMFITSYVTAYLLYVHPYAFSGFEAKAKLLRLIMVVFNTTFLPLFAVFLMWRLRLIESMLLRTPRERIIPYVAAMICYWWAWWVTKNQPDNPQYFVDFMLGGFLSVCGAWFCNIYFKVSMHSTAMGGLVVFFFLQIFHQIEPTGFYFSIALLIAGLVGTARFIVSDHRAGEIYIGYVVGAASQLVAWWL